MFMHYFSYWVIQYFVSGDINMRSNMRELCRAAFIEDKIEFVSLFLGLDLDLSRYVTRHELRLLYLHSVKHMSYLRKMFHFNKPPSATSHKHETTKEENQVHFKKFFEKKQLKKFSALHLRKTFFNSGDIHF